MSTRPTVLFVAYGGGHVTMVLPVLKALRAKKPAWNLKLMALTTGVRRAESAGEMPLTYRDFVHLVDRNQMLAFGQELLQENASPDVADEESIAYLGINFLDLVKSYGVAGARQRYAKHKRHCFSPVDFMTAVLRDLSVDMVVVTNSPRTEEATVIASRALGLPSLAMVDLFDRQDVSFMDRPVTPTIVTALNDEVRDKLLGSGGTSDQVVVAGNPAFDGLFSPELQVDARAWTERKGWEGLRKVLYAGHSEFLDAENNPQDLPQRIEQELRGVIDTNPDLALVIRYHPSDWHKYPVPEPHPRIHFSIPPQEPLHPVLLASDAVVVQRSTVGLEAAVLGKRVFATDFTPSAQMHGGWTAVGISQGLASLREIKSLPELMDDEAPPTSLKYETKGTSADKISDLVIRTLDESSKVG